MPVEENIAAFRRYVKEVWIEEDLDFVDEIFAGKYLSHQPDGSVLERGPEDVKKFVREYRSAFSDIEDVIEDMIGEGDRVAPAGGRRQPTRASSGASPPPTRGSGSRASASSASRRRGRWWRAGTPWTSWACSGNSAPSPQRVRVALSA